MTQHFNSLEELMHAASCSCPMCKSMMSPYEHAPVGTPININMSFNKSAIPNQHEDKSRGENT